MINKRLSALLFFIGLIIKIIVLYTLGVFLKESINNKCQITNYKNIIEKENKIKNMRIDQISQVVTNLSERYTGIGQGFEEVLDDIKENRTINIDQKIADLPDDMFQIFVSRNIEIHGIKNYLLFDDSFIYPMNKDTSYIPEKFGEFGRRPKLFDTMTYQYVYSISVEKSIMEWHNGNDIVNPYDSRIFSVKDGQVIKTGHDDGAGRYIIILHSEKEKPLRRTRYFHLYEIFVEKDQIVKQGQVIGLVGDSGKKSIGKHLHFELQEIREGRWIYKNFFIGTTHNRKWIAGYYWIKLKDGRWITKIL